MYDAGLLPGPDSNMPDRGPPRPDIADDPNETGELIFRLGDVQLNGEVDWRNVGRNLDGFVTTADNQGRQCSPPMMQAAPADGPGGIDNAMGPFLGIIEFQLECLESRLAESHLAGEGTLMLWVQNWNGGPNDSNVVVSLVVAADATSLPASDVMWNSTTHRLVLTSDDTMDAPPPSGDPTDNYYLRPDSFSGGSSPIPKLRDTSAYIADGMIVYSLPDRGEIPLNAGFGSLIIAVTDGLMLVQMSESLDSIESGELSGRFPLDALLDAGTSIGICEGTAPLVETQFRRILDVMANAALPPNPATECDALSLGIPFRGTRASFPRTSGEPTRSGTNPPLPDACAIGVDPCP